MVKRIFTIRICAEQVNVFTSRSLRLTYKYDNCEIFKDKFNILFLGGKIKIEKSAASDAK